MPFAGGIFTLVPTYRAFAGQTIRTEQHNPVLEDIASGLSSVLPRDGSGSMTGPLRMGGQPVTNSAPGVEANDLATIQQVQNLIAAAGLVPPGTMSVYTISSSAAPAGYVFANGQTLQRSTHATLWAAVQAGNNLASTEGGKTRGQYGPGNGSTTFTVPNLVADNGYFIRPASPSRGIGSVQLDTFVSHTHTGQTTSNGEHAHDYVGPFNAIGLQPGGSVLTVLPGSAITSIATPHLHELVINAAGGDETRPKNVAYPVIIKT